MMERKKTTSNRGRVRVLNLTPTPMSEKKRQERIIAKAPLRTQPGSLEVKTVSKLRRDFGEMGNF